MPSPIIFLYCLLNIKTILMNDDGLKNTFKIAWQVGNLIIIFSHFWKTDMYQTNQLMWKTFQVKWGSLRIEVIQILRASEVSLSRRILILIFSQGLLHAGQWWFMIVILAAHRYLIDIILLIFLILIYSLTWGYDEWWFILAANILKVGLTGGNYNR